MESTNKLLRIADVSRITTLAKSTIWLKVSQNQFPKPTKLSASITVWKESDVWKWIDDHFQTSASLAKGDFN
ncbi:AlpA family transcriptional regulator [Polynucleobacter sp. MWH-Braz-FAM2G]|uniref:helix-turn-helix transcriptional regulator n=1 Tax=Polynucleobacter sp. MWH-Braz-FAM2G TaxID=1855883 RepID=UPI001BFED8AE|nr:AlpA family phage regulatory protein [Polynucleobacter sp. MWH-Braz-FAM2G]QWD91777.1 AlpA family phage regulatory protein [Polynucleobacter sp. MWH-Braz-FAM2G]